jgi:hypothetical protein
MLALEETTRQLISKENKNEGFEGEVHHLLEQLGKHMDSSDLRLQKLEVDVISGKEDAELKTRLEKIISNYDIMHVRLKELEFSRGPLAELSTSMQNRLEQLSEKQQGQSVEWSHQVMELEARWSKQFTEIRTSMDKDMIDFELAIRKAMVQLPTKSPTTTCSSYCVQFFREPKCLS